MASNKTATNRQVQKEKKNPVITIEAAAPVAEIKLRVAAYVRVSSDSTDQLNSFSAQTKHYTSLISGKENWSIGLEKVRIFVYKGKIYTSY